ncbi:hypothetical protein [Paenibacillus sp. BC26]|uniref:hypothetical protein n=1 Tax=Paenibacillus sp. BC26 TaxID=1881032 RepID=UPI0008E430C7|nr:hypothetical protein [Paenibacillus sp. BC26]SFS76685.1 hypothetical protein SAMN05428962_2735 [Paenibacillus sp. BC26]
MTKDKMIGAELYFVTFISDYVQFGLVCGNDDAVLTAWALPTVTVKDVEYHFESIGFRDALCELINLTVEDVHTFDDGFKIIFQGNDELLIRPSNEERELLAEYAMFVCGDWWEVWN